MQLQQRADGPARSRALQGSGPGSGRQNDVGFVYTLAREHQGQQGKAEARDYGGKAEHREQADRQQGAKKDDESSEHLVRKFVGARDR